MGEEAWAAREDVAFARAFASRLPANSLVLTHNPNMFLLWGTSAAQASIAATEAEYVRAVYFPRYRGGVYFHWNFWCNVNDPVQRQFCVERARRGTSTRRCEIAQRARPAVHVLQARGRALSAAAAAGCRLCAASPPSASMPGRHRSIRVMMPPTFAICSCTPAPAPGCCEPPWAGPPSRSS